jgi:3-hydroxybutyryl-CoA dehydrogenase
MRSPDDPGIKVVAVLGLGTMGRGIALVCARAGFEVRAFDADPDQAKRADAAPEDGIVVTPTITEACAGAQIIIEAIPESLEAKVALFQQIKLAAPSDAILASNTSSLSITELGKRSGESSRTLGLHFFNPPTAMELVEVVQGADTDSSVIDAALVFVSAIGKKAILVRDAPGFATSRLGVALGAEAMRMVEEGVASVADIDRAMELGYRHAMGPLKVTDLVGLDVRLAILEHLERQLGERFRPPAILRRLVSMGRHGKKVGVGFYRWTDAGPVAEAWE